MSFAASMVYHRRLEGKVAIVTGGASGIGASTVKLFHENGSKVIIADIQDDLGQAIADKLGDNACYIHCNVSNEDDVSNLIYTTMAKHGKLDIMYNNAGIMDHSSGSILDATKADLDCMIGVNLVGAFLGAKHAARVMVPQRHGCILFTTSASVSVAGFATHAYTVSKYGIMGLARNLAAELGQYGIRVNCVSPYAVVTGIKAKIDEAEIPKIEAALSEKGNLKGQILKPEGIAQAALFLASDEANYVSGLDLVVDGGFSIVNPTYTNGFKKIEREGNWVI